MSPLFYLNFFFGHKKSASFFMLYSIKTREKLKVFYKTTWAERRAKNTSVFREFFWCLFWKAEFAGFRRPEESDPVWSPVIWTSFAEGKRKLSAIGGGADGGFGRTFTFKTGIRWTRCRTILHADWA